LQFVKHYGWSRGADAPPGIFRNQDFSLSNEEMLIAFLWYIPYFCCLLYDASGNGEFPNEAEGMFESFSRWIFGERIVTFMILREMGRIEFHCG